MTDIMDDHSYKQDPEEFAQHYANVAVDGSFTDRWDKYQSHLYTKEIPFFCSEYGGIAWQGGKESEAYGVGERKTAWGYGQAPVTEQEFLHRLKALTDVLLDNDEMFGFCYTQLTDVEQEINGLYTYDRTPKFDPEKIHAIFSKKAAIED
jgi:hypothetical protein